MIRVVSVPAASASATTAQYLVECDETLCKWFCIGSDVVSTMSIKSGDVTTINGLAVVPLIVTIAVATPDQCGCHSQMFIEKADVALTATDDNTISITQGASTLTKATHTKCCKSKSVRVTSSFSVTIS